MEDKVKAVQLRIDLKGAKPPIWRRVSVPINYTFAQLHEIIQILFGWQGYHMHEFDIPYLHLLLRETRDDDFLNLYDQTVDLTRHVGLINLKEGATFTYIYDFGDWWEHKIKVEKFIEQEEDYPKLLKWRQDNACEDAGGIYGYYDKLQYLEKSNHPDVEDIRSWFAMQHIDFEEEVVRLQLEGIGGEDVRDMVDEEPFINAMKDMLDVFDYVDEDALFHIITLEQKEWYVWLHEGEEQRKIRMFDNAYDCAISCLYEQEEEQSHTLFTNGIVFEYPDFLEDYEEDEEYENPIDAILNGKFGYQCFGKMHIHGEEADSLICFIRDVLCSVIDSVKGDLTMFPNANEELKSMCVHIQENQLLEMTWEEFEMTPVKEKITVDSSMIEAIASKVNTDSVYTSIMQIPNLLHDEIDEDFVYVFILKGKRVEELHLFERLEMAPLGDFIAQHLFSYMEKQGKPAHLYCNDERIRQMLHSVCKQIRLPLDYRSMDFMMERDLFSKAMKLQNPPELYDKHFLDNIEEKLQNGKHPEEMGKLFQKFIRYMTYDTYINEEEDT